jgi:tetratricopeptide (TPR) repeat protein
MYGYAAAVFLGVSVHLVLYRKGIRNLSAYALLGGSLDRSRRTRGSGQAAGEAPSAGVVSVSFLAPLPHFEICLESKSMLKKIVNTRLVCVAALLAVVSACTIMAKQVTTAQAPVITGFGETDFVITTKSEKAQALFRQGLLQAYAFNEPEAVRAFKAALVEDPDCAMCAWGVAYQLGPTLVRPGRAQVDEANQHIALAQQKIAAVSPLERDLIEAMALRYATGRRAAELTVEFSPLCGNGPMSEKADPLDFAYAAKMQQLASTYSASPDVLVMYAEAEMLTTPGRFWVGLTNQAVGRTGEIADRLESMLAAHPNHTGLNHYLLHAVDSNAVAYRAVPAAERLAGLAPASPHMQHMSTHIFTRLGRYHDATQANVAALAAEDALDASLRAQGFESVKNWRPHNSQFLLFSALMEGRGAVALGMARTIAQNAAQADSSFGEFARAQPLLALLRLERYDELLRETPPQGTHGVASVLSQYTRGVALARTQHGTQALAALEQVRAQVPAVLTSHASDSFPDRMVRTIVQVAHELFEAEVAAQSGQNESALEHAAAAAKTGEPLDILDPAMLSGSPRLALGDMQLRLGRWQQAEATFRQDLAMHPRSGWALRGLIRALQGQGRQDEVEKLRGEINLAWSLADANLRERL